MMVEGNSCGNLGTYSPGTHFVLRGPGSRSSDALGRAGPPLMCCVAWASAFFCLGFRLLCALTPFLFWGDLEPVCGCVLSPCPPPLKSHP